MAAPRRNRKIRIFESSIEKLGRILSQKWSIRVVFKAGECKTSGKVIYLPTLPDNASQDLMDAMQGHLDHETAHVIFTDFSVVEKIKRKDKKLFTCLNALEDPRIERKMAELWRGAAVNLHRSHEWTLRNLSTADDVPDPATPGKKVKQRPWDGLSDFGKVLIAATIYAHVKFDQSHWFMRDVVEPDVLQKVVSCEPILREAVAADTTVTVLECAKRLMKHLNEEEEPVEEIDPEDIPDDAVILPPGAGPSPQQQVLQKKQPKDPNAPMVVQLEEADEDSENGLPQPRKNALSAQGAKTPKLGNSEPGGLDMAPTAAELDNDASLTSMEKMLQEAAAQEFTGKDSYLIYTTEGDKIERIKDGDRVAYKDFMLESRATVSVMKRKMSRSLLATNVSRWEGDKTRGKINPRAIFRVSLGTSKRVFREKVEAEDFDTAIQIAVDHSGSMSGHKLELAARTSIILGEIANQLGIPFSVVGFSTGDDYVSGRRFGDASKAEQKAYARWGNHWIGMYKDFDESWSSSNHKLINMVQQQRINTYDGESLRLAAQRLMRRPEKRKILFWLNDGEPCPNSADNHLAHVEYAKLCAQEVEKMVELLAVGITTSAVKNYYSNYVVVNDVKDLPSVCLGQLDDMLRKGKKLVPNAKKKAA